MGGVGKHSFIGLWGGGQGSNENMVYKRKWFSKWFDWFEGGAGDGGGVNSSNSDYLAHLKMVCWFEEGGV